MTIILVEPYFYYESYIYLYLYIIKFNKLSICDEFPSKYNFVLFNILYLYLYSVPALSHSISV